MHLAYYYGVDTFTGIVLYLIGGSEESGRRPLAGTRVQSCCVRECMRCAFLFPSFWRVLTLGGSRSKREDSPGYVHVHV